MGTQGRSALVTGASRGIGKTIALALASAGFDLILSARTINPGETRDNGLSIHGRDLRPLPGSLSETAALCDASGVRTLIVPFDLTDRAAVGAAAQRILSDWNGVDAIVHNGRYLGVGMMDRFLDTPIDAYDRFVEAHGIAPIILTRALLPGMIERGRGSIVTITSNAAQQPPRAPPGEGGWGLAYSVGKASGHVLTGALHAEFAAVGIRAFGVDPGAIVTERSGLVLGDHGIDTSRSARPELIGSVVRWLLTAPEGERYAGTTVKAQELHREFGLGLEMETEGSVA